MTRHQRRKAAKARWTEKAERLVAAHHAWERDMRRKANLGRTPINPETGKPYVDRLGREITGSSKRPERSPKGMGNRAVYTGSTGHYGRVAGEGRGNRDVLMNDRELTKFRSSLVKD